LHFEGEKTFLSFQSKQKQEEKPKRKSNKINKMLSSSLRTQTKSYEQV